MKKWILLPLIMIVAAGAVSAADLPEDQLVIQKTAQAYEVYSERMGNAMNGEQIVWALNELSTSLEELGPAMNKISKEHPSWLGNKPPENVAELMQRYQKAAELFNNAMGRAVMYANSHMDDQEFQKAFRRANEAIYEMYK